MAINIDELITLSESKLKEIAKEHDIPRRALNKAELIDALYIESLLKEDETKNSRGKKIANLFKGNKNLLNKNSQEPWKNIKVIIGGLFASLIFFGLSTTQHK